MFRICHAPLRTRFTETRWAGGVAKVQNQKHTHIFVYIKAGPESISFT